MPDISEPDLLPLAKRLLRSIRNATLATVTPEGNPFASLTTVATLPDGSPVLLLSRLALHTTHLDADRRCSVLLAEVGRGDPLAHPRLTLVGSAERLGPEAIATARRRFLARNPKAELYADFPDFAFWRMHLETGHLNGGFGRAARFSADEILTSLGGSDALVAGEDGAVAHMNADHRDALGLYATRLLGLPEADWHLSGLDPEGLDLVAGDLTGRLTFPRRVATGGELRSLLVQLVAEAKARPA